MTVHDEPGLAFGGVKNSGWGRFNAEQGMEEFLVTKVVTWDDRRQSPFQRFQVILVKEFCSSKKDTSNVTEHMWTEKQAV